MVDQTEPHDIFTIWKCFSSNMLLLWWEIIDLSVIGSDVWNKALHHLDQSWEMTEALTSKTTYWISIASWYYFTHQFCHRTFKFPGRNWYLCWFWWPVWTKAVVLPNATTFCVLKTCSCWTLHKWTAFCPVGQSSAKLMLVCRGRAAHWPKTAPVERFGLILHNN